MANNFLEEVEPSNVKGADCFPTLNFMPLEEVHEMYVSVSLL